jgi:hypothetical protein
LNCSISDTLHSTDPSALCWRRMFQYRLWVECVQGCYTVNT